MSPKAPQSVINKTSVRAAKIGAAALRQRMSRREGEPPPAQQANDEKTEITERLRILLDRQEHGQKRWKHRSISDAIANCRAELKHIEESGKHRKPSK